MVNIKLSKARKVSGVNAGMAATMAPGNRTAKGKQQPAFPTRTASQGTHSPRTDSALRRYRILWKLC